MELSGEALRGYLDYLRDLGVYDFYRQVEPGTDPELQARLQEWLQTLSPAPAAAPQRKGSAAPPPVAQRIQPPVAARPAVARPATPAARPGAGPEIFISPQSVPPSPAPAMPRPAAPVVPPQRVAAADDLPPFDFESAPNEGPFAPPAMPLVSFNQLAPIPAERLAPAAKPAALQALRDTIGDCTRCPLAYAGRHKIVFADGDSNAELMFVGEGPGADEDASGLPFVGKAGQLLNNMISAMGLKREQVYIANIVKCRPPKNRVPEPVEANTCSPFLLEQIDIVQPKVIVALGATAATYLLGVKQSLTGLRGRWHDVRGAKCAVTYHPAFLLRDPRQKGEAWKDLQRVMVELNLKPPARG